MGSVNQSGVQWPVASWVPGDYARHDMVQDDGWLMVANKPTNERPSPQPTGPEYWVSQLGDSPSWVPGSSSSTQVLTGQRYTWGEAGYITGYRYWTPLADGSVEYELWLVLDPLGVPQFDEVVAAWKPSDGVIGWREQEIPPLIIAQGTVFDLILVARATSTGSSFQGDWNYAATNSPNPGSGAINHRNNGWEFVVNNIDANSGNRGTELQGFAVGGKIRTTTGEQEWTVSEVSAGASTTTFTVTPTTRIPGGLYTFEFEDFAAQLIDYVEIVNHYQLNSAVQGFFSTDGYSATNLTFNENAYGVDIQVQQADLPEDWDFASFAGGEGGGGGGGVDTYTALLDTPSSYAGEAGSYQRVNGGESALEHGTFDGTLTSVDDVPAGPSTDPTEDGLLYRVGSTGEIVWTPNAIGREFFWLSGLRLLSGSFIQFNDGAELTGLCRVPNFAEIRGTGPGSILDFGAAQWSRLPGFVAWDNTYPHFFEGGATRGVHIAQGDQIFTGGNTADMTGSQDRIAIYIGGRPDGYDDSDWSTTAGVMFLHNIDQGSNSVYLGAQAGQNATGGADSLGIGSLALASNAGTFNIGVGRQALGNLGTARSITAIGGRSGDGLSWMHPNSEWVAIGQSAASGASGQVMVRRFVTIGHLSSASGESSVNIGQAGSVLGGATGAINIGANGTVQANHIEAITIGRSRTSRGAYHATIGNSIEEMDFDLSVPDEVTVALRAAATDPAWKMPGVWASARAMGLSGDIDTGENLTITGTVVPDPGGLAVQEVVKCYNAAGQVRYLELMG